MNDNQLQSLTTDQFFYFFLRLRKGEVRRTVQSLTSRYPDERPEQLAQRLIAAKSRLAILGGGLLNLPLAVPGVGQALKLAGMVGATSMLTRMHLYLILEVALVFGKDIDDRARVSEMAAVVAATGLSSATSLWLLNQGLQPLYAIPAAALSATLTTRLIGRSALNYYRQTLSARPFDASPPFAPGGVVVR